MSSTLLAALTSLGLLVAACNPGTSATPPSTPVDTSFPATDLGDATSPLPDVDAQPSELPSPETTEEVADDTGVDAAAETETGPADTDAAGTCAEGAPCDDGDNCTVNDQCLAGACTGTPLDCADNDGLPCTSGACQDGGCVTVIAAGFCAIDGACWTTGQPNPAGGCQACDPGESATTWTGDGSTCDDGDPCTHTDTCLPGGGCAGTPIVCPADADPCTVSACVAGVCQNSPAGNGVSCDDGDPCTLGETCSGGTCSGGQPKDSDNDGAVDVACGGDDCNDGTSALGPNVAENCSDLLDNDCDGDTDGADSDCDVTAPPTCTHHTDCYPEGVCAAWPGSGQSYCSAVCAGDTDCEAGQVCNKVPGSANVGYCRIPIPGSKPNGSTCSSGAECASLVCLDSICTATCFDEGHCLGSGSTCGLIGDTTSGDVAGLCLPNGSFFPNGQQCLLGGNTNSGVCASGHCDLMNVPGPYTCAPLCKTQSDCAADEECDFVVFMDVPNAQSISYDPIVDAAGTTGQKSPRDAAMGCYSRVNPGGAIADGTPCSTNDQCQGGRCLALIPGNSTQYCTRFCALDGDCGAGMSCKLELITIVSDFLVNFDTPQADYWSYARICKFD